MPELGFHYNINCATTTMLYVLAIIDRPELLQLACCNSLH